MRTVSAPKIYFGTYLTYIFSFSSPIKYPVPSSNSFDDSSSSAARLNKNRTRRIRLVHYQGFAFRVSCRVPCHSDSRWNSERVPPVIGSSAPGRETRRGIPLKFRCLRSGDAISLVRGPSDSTAGDAVHFFLRPSYVYFFSSPSYSLRLSPFFLDSLVGIVLRQTAVINRAWQSLLGATEESFGKIDSFGGVAKGDVRKTRVFISQFFHKSRKYLMHPFLMRDEGSRNLFF